MLNLSKSWNTELKSDRPASETTGIYIKKSSCPSMASDGRQYALSLTLIDRTRFTRQEKILSISP